MIISEFAKAVTESSGSWKVILGFRDVEGFEGIRLQGSGVGFEPALEVLPWPSGALWSAYIWAGLLSA